MGKFTTILRLGPSLLGLSAVFLFASSAFAADAFADAIALPVPEPASLSIFGAGAIGVILARKLRRKK